MSRAGGHDGRIVCTSLGSPRQFRPGLRRGRLSRWASPPIPVVSSGTPTVDDDQRSCWQTGNRPWSTSQVMTTAPLKGPKQWQTAPKPTSSRGLIDLGALAGPISATRPDASGRGEDGRALPRRTNPSRWRPARGRTGVRQVVRTWEWALWRGRSGPPVSRVRLTPDEGLSHPSLLSEPVCHRLRRFAGSPILPRSHPVRLQELPIEVGEILVANRRRD